MSDFELPSGTTATLFKASAKTSSKAQTKASTPPSTPEAVPTSVAEKDEVKPEKVVAPPKFTDEELDTVFDSLMFEGSYTEEISLRNGKLKISLRNRSASEVSAIMDKLDLLGANLAMTHSHYQVTYNLIYSLVSYQGTKLEEVSLEDKEKFIGKLPAPVLSMLIMALQDFDKKVAAATKYGEQNF